MSTTNEYTWLFEELPPGDQRVVQEVVAHFHVRNSVRHEDGSVGEIIITPAEFRDALAYMVEAYADR